MFSLPRLRVGVAMLGNYQASLQLNEKNRKLCECCFRVPTEDLPKTALAPPTETETERVGVFENLYELLCDWCDDFPNTVVRVGVRENLMD